MTLALEEGKAKLVKFGFRPAMVKAEIITGACSRAGAIAGYAEQEDFGTIVMGRRGISRVHDFCIGRVNTCVSFPCILVTIQPIRSSLPTT